LWLLWPAMIGEVGPVEGPQTTHISPSSILHSSSSNAEGSWLFLRGIHEGRLPDYQPPPATHTSCSDQCASSRRAGLQQYSFLPEVEPPTSRQFLFGRQWPAASRGRICWTRPLRANDVLSVTAPTLAEVAGLRVLITRSRTGNQADSPASSVNTATLWLNRLRMESGYPWRHCFAVQGMSRWQTCHSGDARAVRQVHARNAPRCPRPADCAG